MILTLHAIAVPDVGDSWTFRVGPQASCWDRRKQNPSPITKRSTLWILTVGNIVTLATILEMLRAYGDKDGNGLGDERGW